MKNASLVHLAVGLALASAVACADSAVTSGPAAEAAQKRALADDVGAAEYIRANLTALRAQSGRSPAGTFVVAEPLLRRARVRILAGRPADQVLEDQLQLAANNGERDIGYWSTEVTSPDDIHFPAKLVRSRRMNVAIVVVRSPSHSGKPSMLVLFAMAEPDQSN